MNLQQALAWEQHAQLQINAAKFDAYALHTIANSLYNIDRILQDAIRVSPEEFAQRQYPYLINEIEQLQHLLQCMNTQAGALVLDTLDAFPWRHLREFRPPRSPRELYDNLLPLRRDIHQLHQVMIGSPNSLYVHAGQRVNHYTHIHNTIVGMTNTIKHQADLAQAELSEIYQELDRIKQIANPEQQIRAMRLFQKNIQRTPPKLGDKELIGIAFYQAQRPEITNATWLPNDVRTTDQHITATLNFIDLCKKIRTPNPNSKIPDWFPHKISHDIEEVKIAAVNLKKQITAPMEQALSKTSRINFLKKSKPLNITVDALKLEYFGKGDSSTLADKISQDLMSSVTTTTATSVRDQKILFLAQLRTTMIVGEFATKNQLSDLHPDRKKSDDFHTGLRKARNATEHSITSPDALLHLKDQFQKIDSGKLPDTPVNLANIKDYFLKNTTEPPAFTEFYHGDGIKWTKSSKNKTVHHLQELKWVIGLINEIDIHNIKTNTDPESLRIQMLALEMLAIWAGELVKDLKENDIHGEAALEMHVELESNLLAMKKFRLQMAHWILDAYHPESGMFFYTKQPPSVLDHLAWLSSLEGQLDDVIVRTEVLDMIPKHEDNLRQESIHSEAILASFHKQISEIHLPKIPKKSNNTIAGLNIGDPIYVDFRNQLKSTVERSPATPSSKKNEAANHRTAVRYLKLCLAQMLTTYTSEERSNDSFIESMKCSFNLEINGKEIELTPDFIAEIFSLYKATYNLIEKQLEQYCISVENVLVDKLTDIQTDINEVNKRITELQSEGRFDTCRQLELTLHRLYEIQAELQVQHRQVTDHGRENIKDIIIQKFGSIDEITLNMLIKETTTLEESYRQSAKKSDKTYSTPEKIKHARMNFTPTTSNSELEQPPSITRRKKTYDPYETVNSIANQGSVLGDGIPRLDQENRMPPNVDYDDIPENKSNSTLNNSAPPLSEKETTAGYCGSQSLFKPKTPPRPKTKDIKDIPSPPR